MTILPRLLFGDNQFFGVNHMSEERARAQAMRFSTTRSMIEVLEAAYDEGIKVFMCTTHERIGEICQHVRDHPRQYPDFQFYPCMPYGVKYANAVTDDGIIGALKHFLPQEGAFGALVKGGLAVATRDVKGIGELLIDAEMKMFQGLNTPVIFLQNLVTDLLLGLGMHEALRIFAQHVRRRYHAEPGYITAYEKAIATRRFQPIAMSVMASGAIPAREALEYVCAQPNIRSIVFGASSRVNIHETHQLVEELGHRRVQREAAVPA